MLLYDSLILVCNAPELAHQSLNPNYDFVFQLLKFSVSKSPRSQYINTPIIPSLALKSSLEFSKHMFCVWQVANVYLANAAPERWI